ncbi:MAG: OmpA family protein [Paracoccaceae bacterium]|nr:OmpA family protein [Paracoccaceae bacterium]
MAGKDDARPIILKRKKVVASDGHHGGAWKVAYADFVTAMMAFFLLMWLLNATSEDQRKGLADYFNPTLPISRTSAGGAGMLSGDDLFTEEIEAASQPEGAPPKPTHRQPGEVLGEEAAAPEAAPGEFVAHSGAGQATEAAPEAGDPELPALAALGPEGTEIEGAGQPANEGDHTEQGDGDGLDTGAAQSSAPDAEADAEAAAEQARLEEIGRQLEEAIEIAESDALDKHFLTRITPEGLVIEIIDADDQPLFASASAEPAPILFLLADILVPVLGETTNDIAVVGHTDSVPFEHNGYSNWELSADRANAARRLMACRGLPESRIARVTGKAAVEPLTDDPTEPQNRRIAITLLRDSQVADPSR